MPEVDVMVLGADHSMMFPNVVKNDPEKLASGYASVATESSLDSFGLFGGGNNYNSFYPDAQPDSFNPNEDEFIEPMFRLLSNCVVAKNTLPTEFPADVLKESMHLLLGMTVNCDHETDIANAIGSIKSVQWQDAYKIGNKTIPAGINGVFKIDAKANPRIARGINMDPPSIHSNSVTVRFEWKPSHNFDKPYEFWDKLGTYAEDGQMVRRIATNIQCYLETSLVWQGADPFAKMIKDGKIINSDYAAAAYGKFSEPADLAKKFWSFSFKTQEDTMHNTMYSKHEGKTNTNSNQSNMNELQQFLEQLFGQGCLTLAEGETASVEIALSQIKTLVSENQTLSEARTQADATIAQLKKDIEERDATIKLNEKMAAIGTSHLSEVRESTVASYKKLMGEQVDETILSLINNETTGLETLLSLKKSYDKQLDEKFPLACANCGSHDISRASSIEENDEETAKVDETKNTEEVSVADTVRNMAKSKIK